MLREHNAISGLRAASYEVPKVVNYETHYSSIDIVPAGHIGMGRNADTE